MTCLRSYFDRDLLRSPQRSFLYAGLAIVVLLAGIFSNSTASHAQEEEPGFFESLFGLGIDTPVPRADAGNIAWKSDLPSGLYDADYSTCVPLMGADLLAVDSAINVHFDGTARITGAAVYVRRLSEEGDVSGEFLDEGMFWDSSLGKVSELGTNATAGVSPRSPKKTSDLKFVITEVSGADANVCLTELDVYGSLEEEDEEAIQKTGLEGNWLVEYSDSDGEKGNTRYGVFTVSPREDTDSTGIWNRSGCVTPNYTGACGGGEFLVEPNGKIHVQYGYYFMGYWGGQADLKQVGPDEVRGRWNYQESYGGSVVWRRVQPEIDRVVMSSEVTDEFSHGQRPGRVEKTFDGYWWGRSVNSRGNRPAFSIDVYGKNLWGQHKLRIEPQSDMPGVDSDLEAYGYTHISEAGHGPPSDVVGLNVQFYVWAGAVPGRKTLYVDDIAIPFDFVAPGHPQQTEDESPALNYAVSLTPDPGTAGERVEFKYILKNPSKDKNLNDVKLDIIFQPERALDGSEAVFGRYLGGDEHCKPVSSETLKPDDEIYFRNSNDYSYHCSVSSLAAGAEVAFAFIQEEAVAGATGYFGIFSASDVEEVQAPATADLVVEPGEAKLSVSVPQFTDPVYTGGDFRKTFIITNTGDARVMVPVLDIELTGDAVPQKDSSGEVTVSVDVESEDNYDTPPAETPPEEVVVEESFDTSAVDLGALKASASLEWDQPAEEGEIFEDVCAASARGFHCEIVPASSFSAGDPYLEAGASERITLSFSPDRAGKIALTARAKGTSHDGKAVSDEQTISTDVEGPVIHFKLLEISPASAGQITNADGTELELHEGGKIELLYLITNTAERASLHSGFLKYVVNGGKISDLAIAELGKECLSPDKIDDVEVVCPIGDFGPGGELTAVATVEFDGGAEIEALVANDVTLPNLFDDYLGEGVPPDAVHWYLVGAKVSPKIKLSFDPAVPVVPLVALGDRFDGMTGAVIPGQKISAHFNVGVAGKGTVHGGFLEIDLPTMDANSRYSVEGATGCDEWHDGGGSIRCGLRPFSNDRPVSVDVQFSAVKQEHVGEKHTFTWKLELPDTYVGDGDAPKGGDVTFDVVPRYADMKVEVEETPETATAGEANKLIFNIINEGTWTEQEAWVNVEVGIKGLLHADNPRVEKVFLALPDKEDLETVHGVNCRLWVESGIDARCALGEIGPSRAATVRVEWVPLPEDIGKEFYFSIKVDSGIGEGDIGGSEEDNHLYGTGKVLEGGPD